MASSPSSWATSSSRGASSSKRTHSTCAIWISSGLFITGACSSADASAGKYVFTRLIQAKEPVRQRYELSLSGSTASLSITTSGQALRWRANVKDGPGKNEISLDLKSTDDHGTNPQWICQRTTTHVYPDGARCDAEPSEQLDVLSCREQGQADVPPRDRAEERHRDTNRWTLAPGAGVELVTLQCGSDGMLRRNR